MKRPRLVVDTNVLVSALLWGGVPSRLIDLAGNGTVSLITSRALLTELHATLQKPRLSRFVTATGLTPAAMVKHMRRLSTVVATPALPHRVARDRDDDAVLACARAGNASMIVTGDRDLPVLRAFDGIPILRPAPAVELLVPP